MTNNPTLTDLRDQGYRITPQRLAILRVLREDGGHLSPLEVFQRAQTILPGLTEPTVYRTLTFLTNQGLVMASVDDNLRLIYEIADHAHHHLICRSCAGSISIDHQDLETLYQELEDRTGFLIDSFHLTFFGLCPDCRSAAA